MKSFPSRSIHLLIAVGILVAFARSSQARLGRKHRTPPKSVYTAIASVNLTEMTITTVQKNSTATGSKTFRFTPQTTVTVDDHPGTLADLKPGQRIRVGAGADPDVAEELSATKPPANPK